MSRRNYFIDAALVLFALYALASVGPVSGGCGLTWFAGCALR